MIVDGNALANEILDGVKKRIEFLGCSPKLAVIMAGDDPVTERFLNMKKKKAEQVTPLTLNSQFEIRNSKSTTLTSSGRQGTDSWCRETDCGMGMAARSSRWRTSRCACRGRRARCSPISICGSRPVRPWALPGVPAPENRP